MALMTLVAAGLAAAGPLPSWDQAYERASTLVSQMTLEEKAGMMRGIGWTNGVLDKWWYVGNTPPVPRLGIPSLNMQDAAGGFRTYWTELVGTVTCWPSLLSMAATFDVDIMLKFAQALGAEFKGKGANVILGPSINVHRVARGGRNFEYLSGEDPYLGARLAEKYVAGVQSAGVMSVMKHFVFNNQETNRFTESSVVDDKTAWELYYPPFEAAVNAGASAAMCSYNLEDGTWACENDARLNRDLKGAMGFRGFVQSDWGATHSTSVTQGLDMEMPMSNDSTSAANASHPFWFSPAQLRRLNVSKVDDAVTRILAAMVRLDVLNSTVCSPPNCKPHLMANVTSDEHASLARDAAVASVVLLQNNDSTLPLAAPGVKTIAVVGAASVGKVFDPAGASQGHGQWNTGDYYSGGGSGHVTAGYVITPLRGIQRRAAAAGISVLASPTDNVTSAVQVAAQADVTIVVGGTSSGEALDRANLSLDGGADALVSAVAAAAKRTVVLMQVPGATLTPWSSEVHAILTLFLGGQETGTAWGATLFGDVSPSGRLPVSFPASEADTIPPNPSLAVPYTEGTATGYRNTAVKPKFAFGHGLGFSTFSFGAPANATCTDAHAVLCVTSVVTNTGKFTAGTVAQAYVTFSPEAGQHAPLLKGFVKTPALGGGGTHEVTFELSERDVSYYADGWRKAASVTVSVGASSADVQGGLRHVFAAAPVSGLVEQ